MKTCPNCGELCGDDVKKCFNCFYEFEIPEQEVEDQINAVISINDIYEYDVVSLNDTKHGSSDLVALQEILSEHGRNGWRLVNTVTNELGHNSSSVSLCGMTSKTNATIDQIILIFERCVKRRS